MSGSPEVRVSLKLRAIADALDEILREIAGEKMGFALLVFPLDRLGGANYIGNCKREDMAKQLHGLLERWEQGMSDVPLHEKH